VRIDGAIMFEVVSDWNYAAAVFAVKALSFSARAARTNLPHAESAFSVAREKIFS
jgi:hypothetical protein